MNLIAKLKSPGGRKFLQGLGLVGVFVAGHFLGPTAAIAVQKVLDLLAIPALQMLGVM